MRFSERFFQALYVFEADLAQRKEILTPEEAVDLFFTEERCSKLGLLNTGRWRSTVVQLLAADGYEFEQEYADEEFYATEDQRS